MKTFSKQKDLSDVKKKEEFSKNQRQRPVYSYGMLFNPIQPGPT